MKLVDAGVPSGAPITITLEATEVAALQQVLSTGLIRNAERSRADQDVADQLGYYTATGKELNRLLTAALEERYKR